LFAALAFSLADFLPFDVVKITPKSLHTFQDILKAQMPPPPTPIKFLIRSSFVLVLLLAILYASKQSPMNFA